MRAPSSRAIEVTTPRKSRSRGSIQRHFAALPPDEVTAHHGIPVTTVPRTLFDLAAVSAADVVEQALRGVGIPAPARPALTAPICSLVIRDVVAQRRCRECLKRRRELPAGRARSWLEVRVPTLSATATACRGLGSTFGWRWEGGSIEVDCLWSGEAVVELDGFAAHGTRVAFPGGPGSRDRRLRVAGYGVIRIAPEQLDEEPDEIEADLRALIMGGRERATLSGRPASVITYAQCATDSTAAIPSLAPRDCANPWRSFGHRWPACQGPARRDGLSPLRDLAERSGVSAPMFVAGRARRDQPDPGTWPRRSPPAWS